MLLCEPCHSTLVESRSSKETIHQTIASFLKSVDAKCCICHVLFLQLPEDQREKLRHYSSPEISPKIWMHSPSNSMKNSLFIPYVGSGTVTSYARTRDSPSGVIHLTIKILTLEESDDTKNPLRLPEWMGGSQPWLIGSMTQIVDSKFWTTAPSITLTPIKSKVELEIERRPWSIASDSTFSSETFGKIETWLNICANTHDQCNLRRQNTEKQRSKAQWLPTRLVKIISPGQNCWNPSQSMVCRIVETKSENTLTLPSYITLSHRWTEDNVEILNKDNLCQWNVEIPLTVSKTFRDVFKVARKLGISYVWIDSLCIIQNDLEDWNLEAPQMGKVYANAKFNVCASLDNMKQGLFSTRVGANLAMSEIYIAPRGNDKSLEDGGLENMNKSTSFGNNCPVGDDDHQSSKFYQHSGYFLVAKSTPGFMWEQSILRSPLKDRGWVFQEQLLSPANFHFGSNEVLFDCLEMRASESLGMEHEWPFKSVSWKGEAFKVQLPVEQDFMSVDKSNNESSNHDEYDETFFSYDSFGDSDEAHISIYERWYSLVSKYSARQFTHHEDRLKALSAVAQYFKELTPDGDIYIAGLFKHFLCKAAESRRRYMGVESWQKQSRCR